MNLFERFMFKKIELWLVALLLIVILVLTVLFGAVVRNAALGHSRFGWIGEAAFEVSSFPAQLEDVLSFGHPSNAMLVYQGNRFEGKKGWNLTPEAPGDLPDGYLLHSHYDGNLSRHVVELFDFQKGEVVHRIVMDPDTLYDGANKKSGIRRLTHWNAINFRAIHPLPLANGDMIIKDHTAPLWRINACGQPQFRLENDLYHHSTERADDGLIWVSTYMEPSPVEGAPSNLYDPGIVAITEDGDIVYEESLTKIMLEAGLGYLMFDNIVEDADPLHLNDIQPVNADGPFWKKGDLFLSLRHISTIMLFRPSTKEIIWMKTGPWTAQHDVDIIDDHTIGVFNNNMLNINGRPFVDGTSEVLFYDFAEDRTYSPFKAQFEAYDIRTETEGLFTYLPEGHLLVEEADAGRFLVFSPEGKLVAEHVNRSDRGSINLQGWSRFIARDEGDAFLKAMQAQSCAASG